MIRNATPRWLTTHEGERVVRSSAANRTSGSIAAGGWLVLTTSRLFHHPHIVDRILTRSRDWEVQLSDIVNVDIAAPDAGSQARYDGGRTRRLRVATADGESVFLVVNRTLEWLAAVSDHLTT